MEFQGILEKELLEKYHITLVAVSIDDIDAGSEIEKIIQNKAQAMQQIDIAEKEQERARIEAKTELIKAENKAAVEVELAKGKAEAQELLNSVAVNAIIKMYEGQFATPEAKDDFESSNVGGYLTIQALGEIVVKQLYYDVWDGKLPTVVTDSSGIIIQP